MDASPSPATAASRRPRRRSAGLATVLGWICPGLGQLYVGQPQKGALFLVAVLPAFGLGWWLTDFTGVDPTLYTLDFLAQVLAGGPTSAALHLGQGLALEDLPRWMDVGRLYLSVAGLLNMVAICDAIGEVIHHNRRVDALPAGFPLAAAAEVEEIVLDDEAPPSEAPPPPPDDVEATGREPLERWP